MNPETRVTFVLTDDLADPVKLVVPVDHNEPETPCVLAAARVMAMARLVMDAGAVGRRVN